MSIPVIIYKENTKKLLGQQGQNRDKHEQIHAQLSAV